MKTGLHIKYADIKQSIFDPLVDGCLGIVARNILSVPLKAEHSDRIMGAIHLLNKFEGKVAFTELDDLVATVFSEMAVSTLLGCQKLQHATFRADILSAILSASGHLLFLLPTKDSLYLRQILPFEVLKALEDSSREALRCFKVVKIICCSLLSSFITLVWLLLRLFHTFLIVFLSVLFHCLC